MPSVKRTGVKSAEVKTGFESYDGPEPTKRGMYRARISILQFKKFKANAETGIQAQGLKVQVILEAQAGDPKGHKQFDGYPQFSNVIFGDKEALITRENNFYAALGLKDEPTIVYEDKGDIEQGVDIKTIGGKSLAAIKKMFVNVDLKPRRDGQDGMEVDAIYKLKEVAGRGAGKADEEPEEDEDLLEKDEDAEEETEAEGDDRREELAAAALPDLRALAKEYSIKTVGLKKDDLIDAIIDYEADLPEEEEEPEEDEPEEDEEEPEEEEADDDERAARVAELAGLDRAKLKVVLKGVLPDFTVYKSTTEDDIRNVIIGEEFGEDGETPF